MSLRSRARADAGSMIAREGDPVRVALADGTTRSDEILAIIGVPTQDIQMVNGTQRKIDTIEIMVGEAAILAELRALGQARQPTRGDQIIIEATDDSAQGTWRVDRTSSDHGGLLTLSCQRHRDLSVGAGRKQS